MDYLNFNNHARMIAREVSLATPSDREKLREKYNTYHDMLAGVYAVSIDVAYDEEDVTVQIDFNRKDPFLMMPKNFSIVPKNFSIVYRMKLEDTDDT